MKNIFKVFGVIALVAVIGFSMAACGGDDDSGGGGGTGGGGGDIGSGGTLTVTDIPSKYDGKYALFVAYYTTDTKYVIFACQSPPPDQINVKISNGRVSLPTWYKISGSSDPYIKYSGNDTATSGQELYIYDSAKAFFTDMKSGASYKASITFSNGSATISMSGQQFWDTP